jgi:cell division septum initiation protein DivIVA
MTDTTQDLPPLPPPDASPVTGSIVYHTYSAGTMQAYARQCIATLKAENEKLLAELATHQESSFHPDWSMLEATRSSLRVHMAALKAAQSQAAAMAGLLEDASDFIKRKHGGSTAATDSYDAALAAWKGKA